MSRAVHRVGKPLHKKREKNSTCTFAAAEQANSRFFTYGKGPRPSLSKLSETRPEEHMVLLMGNYI